MFPDFLYRYRPLYQSLQVSEQERNDLEFAALKEPYLWFSRFGELNDPAEIANAEIEPVPDGLEEHLDKVSAGLSEVARVQWRKAQYYTANLIPKDTSSVCCFSEAGNHQAMWAYYANSFQGICVKYDARKLISLSGVCWGDRFFEVQYNNKRLVPAERYISPDRNELAPLSVLTKHTDWAHEKEWRLINREANGKFYHTKNAIDEIILGPRIGDSNKERLVDIGRAAGIKLSQLSFDGHNLVYVNVVTPRVMENRPSCPVEDLVQESRSVVLDQGIDRQTVDTAIEIARSYPSATQVSYVFLGDDNTHLNVRVFFEFPDGKQPFKTLAFPIKNKIVAPVFDYVI